jgi:hypothetical protein
MDWLHRILSGGPTRRGELIAAGIFVAVWFAIDVHQYADFLWSKFNPVQSAICLPITTMPSPSIDNMPLNITPGYWCGMHDCSHLFDTQNNSAR